MRDTLNITAHSGCDGTADDSLEAAEAGMAFGADAVELDIRLDRKGVPVLSHDKDPAKEYGNRPRLAEAFEIIASDGVTAVNCDIKESEAIPAVLDLAAKKGIGPERLVLTGSVPPLLLKENPALPEQAAVWLNVEVLLERLLLEGDEAAEPFRRLPGGETGHGLFRLMAASRTEPLAELIAGRCRSLGVKVLNQPYREGSAAFISRLTEKGIGASVWTINDEEKLKILYTLGVLNVTTRDTRLAVKTRGSFLADGTGEFFIPLSGRDRKS